MKTMTTHQKALDINMDPSRYGSFAEIGAGQEVGRWFFRVGGAAGTIAKTISAYDKQISDAIYGTAQRYVSSGRLLAMLDMEYELNVTRLDRKRGADTAFFAFADTVSAQNYQGTADCQGWMGMRFQAHPRGPSSQIILHARMLDRDALVQHEALGILGVNLIYGASRLSDRPDVFLASLLDNLDKRRIEIDMVEFSGDAFEEVDHRLTSLFLVDFGLCNAAMFSAGGDILRPSEVLYKRPVILQRGRFRPPTKIHADIQKKAFETFASDPTVAADRIISLLEISLKELRETTDATVEDFLDRISALTAGNQSVMVSNCPAHYLVVEYLARFGATQVAIPMGITDFMDLIREERYEDLHGGFLEAAGRLFGMGVRLYVYPEVDPGTERRMDLDSTEIPASILKIFEYLIEREYVRPLDGLPDAKLQIRSDDVLAMLRKGDPEWESHVEPEVVAAIKSGNLFGYKA